MVIQSSQNYYVPNSNTPTPQSAGIYPGAIKPVNQSVAPGFVSTFSGVVRGSSSKSSSGGGSAKKVSGIMHADTKENSAVTEDKTLIFANDTSDETIKKVIAAGSDNPQTFTPGTYLGYQDIKKKQSVYNPQKVVRYNAPVQLEEQVYPTGINTYSDKLGKTEVTVIPPVRRVKEDITNTEKPIYEKGILTGVETTTSLGISDYSVKPNFKGGLDVIENPNTITKITSVNPEQRIAYTAELMKNNENKLSTGDKLLFNVGNVIFNPNTPIVTVGGKVVNTAISGFKSLQGGREADITEFKGNIKDLTSGSYYKNAWETSKLKNYETYGVIYQESNTIGLGLGGFYGIPYPKVTGKVGMFTETPAFQALATASVGYGSGLAFGGLATKATSGSLLASKALTGAKIAGIGVLGATAYTGVIAPYRAGEHQAASENLFKLGAAYAIANPAFKAGYNQKINAYSNRLVREHLNIQQESQGASEETGAYNEATGKGASARISKYSFNIKAGKLGNLEGTYKSSDMGTFEFKNNVILGESTTRGNIQAKGSMLGKGDKLLTGEVYGKNFYELSDTGRYSYYENLVDNNLYSIQDTIPTTVETGSVRLGGKSITAYRINGGAPKTIITNTAGNGGVSYEQLVSSDTGATGLFKSSYNIRSENIVNNRLVEHGAFNLESSGTKKIDFNGNLQNYNIKELISGSGTARLANAKNFVNPNVDDIKGFIYGKTYSIGGESGGLSYEQGGVFLSGGSPLSSTSSAINSFSPSSSLSTTHSALSGVVSNVVSGAITGRVGDVSAISGAIPGITSIFNTRASDSGLTKYESVSVSAPKSEIAAISSYVSEPVSNSIVRADMSDLTNTKSAYNSQASVSAQDLAAATSNYITDTQETAKSDYSTSGITTPVTTITGFTPFSLPGASILGVRGGYSRRGSYKNGKKQYAPSLYAGLTGITSTQKGKSVNITGIGIRPIIIKEKKKKRGNKLW